MIKTGSLVKRSMMESANRARLSSHARRFFHLVRFCCPVKIKVTSAATHDNSGKESET